jgi:surface antigen
MRAYPFTITLAAALAIAPLAVQARPAMLLPGEGSYGDGNASPARGIPPGIQCVPYARARSGVQIYGDAHTWWDQAAGRYARGRAPRVGAVMSFPTHGPMQLGHVAAVSKVIDARTVLLSHANWSPIDGRRGQIEDNVRAVDVSPDGDWSEVRVWYAPLGGLGTTHWPVNGFIYNQKPGQSSRAPLLASSVPVTRMQPVKSRIGADFLKGIVPEASARPRLASTPRPVLASRTMANDPIGRIIASRMR